MEKRNHTTLLQTYIKQHWFKISLLLLILIACLKRDLSFSFKLGSGKDTKNESAKKKASPDSKITTTAVSDATESVPLSIIGNLFGTNAKKEEFPSIDEETKVAFMRRFFPVAIAERKKYGIPSSIIIANAMRQSFAGKRDVTLSSNNHFNLPCTFDWTGKVEKIGENCFRKYENAWVSFRDHSVFVTSGKFADLRNVGETNYKAWAKGLEKMGYPSIQDDLGDDLIKIIESYQLYKLDKM
jgi:flagellum-specific peptidoglycan hydrolase FlgJ